MGTTTTLRRTAPVEFPSGDLKATAGELRWLYSCLRRGKTTRFNSYTRITPGVAVELLKLNTQNRPITKLQVMEHAERLRAGLFILTHHGIAVTDGDILIDGQHRLSAIVYTGISAELEITFGCQHEEFSAIDGGRKRTAANLIAISGMNHYNVRATASSILYRLDNRTASTPDNKTVMDHAAGIVANPKDNAIMDDAIPLASKFSRICSPTSVVTAYYWIRQKTSVPNSKVAVDGFFDGLDTGLGLTHPKLRLREWVRGDQGKALIAEGGGSIKLIAVFIHAWNAYLNNKTTFQKTWGHTNQVPDVR